MSSYTSKQSSLERVRIGKVNLNYKTASKAEWSRLDPTSETDFNIHNVDIRWTITVTQRYAGGQGICTLAFDPEHYRQSEPKIEMDVDNQDPDDDADFLLSFECRNVTMCTISRIAPEGQGHTYTKDDFPLAQLAQSFTAVQPRLPQRFFKPKEEQAFLRTQLSALTSGETTRVSGTAEHAVIKRLMDCALAEEKAVSELLKTQDGCRIETKRVGRDVSSGSKSGHMNSQPKTTSL